MTTSSNRAGVPTPEQISKMQVDAGLSSPPTVDTYWYRKAMSGEGPHAFTWKDKPHRLIFDLCGMLEALSRTGTAVSEGGEPVAWMTADGRIATDETKRTAMANPSRVAFNIPLFASPDYHPHPLGEAQGVTYDKLRAAIELSRNRNVAGGGWSLTDKETDTALEWVAFLAGVGAPCPRIAGFDEGLTLTWPGIGGKHYLILGEDAQGFVLNFKSASLAQQATPRPSGER